MAEDNSDTPNGDAAEQWLKSRNNPDQEKETTKGTDWITEEAKLLYSLGNEIKELGNNIPSDIDTYRVLIKQGIEMGHESNGKFFSATIESVDEQGLGISFEGKPVTGVGLFVGPNSPLREKDDRKFLDSRNPYYGLILECYQGEEGHISRDYLFTEDGHFVKATWYGVSDSWEYTEEVSIDEIELVNASAGMVKDRLEKIVQVKPPTP